MSAPESVIDQTAKGGEDSRRGVPTSAIHVSLQVRFAQLISD